MNKTIICLAVSVRPPSGRCVAGKEAIGGQFRAWIRPISARDGHEVSEDERTYQSGAKAQVLDIVKIPLLSHVPTEHQVENYVLNDRLYWEKVGKATWAQVLAASDEQDPAFWGNSRNTYHGKNDKIPELNANVIGSSLKLVVVPSADFLVRDESGYESEPSRRRLRVKFMWGGIPYLLSVTDPKIREHFIAKGLGNYRIANVAICVSLSLPTYGFIHRLAATIITEKRCLGEGYE